MALAADASAATASSAERSSPSSRAETVSAFRVRSFSNWRSTADTRARTVPRFSSCLSMRSAHSCMFGMSPRSSSPFPAPALLSATSVSASTARVRSSSASSCSAKRVLSRLTASSKASTRPTLPPPLWTVTEGTSGATATDGALLLFGISAVVSVRGASVGSAALADAGRSAGSSPRPSSAGKEAKEPERRPMDVEEEVGLTRGEAEAIRAGLV
mmetsp:Transcript_17095/g.55911  ORF Transcript_17095/g.55911 Transcript_17095/m.55911 type:complete len:215 (+) Transcript_17095:532-1176(+)